MPLALLVLLFQFAPVIGEAHVRSHLDLEFDRHWEAYLLASYGCPPPDPRFVAKPMTPADCTANPKVLAGEFEKARDLAKRVFELQDKKDAAGRRGH